MTLLLLVPLLLLSFYSRLLSAVSIPFDYCLSESYKKHEPTLLQWVPLSVDASFIRDPSTSIHTLDVTVWGNVTGSLYTTPLPDPSDPDWSNPDVPYGKILNQPEPDAAEPKLTTLHTKINFLTYELESDFANFCQESLTNASCPLAPVFNTSAIQLQDLPSVNLSYGFQTSYAFTSLAASFVIVNGNSGKTDISCVSATITPDMGELEWMVSFLPLAVLTFVAFTTVFAGIYSPWGTTDIFHWTSNFGRDPDQLRLVTPGFGDCLQYIQFIALTGALTLNYPGFYQPITSNMSWSVLIFNQSLVTHDPGWQKLVDGIYYTNGSNGLHNFGQLVGMAHAQDIWAGMVVWLLSIISGTLLLIQAGFLVQRILRLVNKTHKEDLRRKNIPFSLGNIVRIVLNYFLLPIVALSTFQLAITGESPAVTVALAVLALVAEMLFAIWLLYLIVTVKPRSFLFDDLPTLLLYGPLYNTYSDEAATFALVPFFLIFIRGLAIGALQASGVAQVVIMVVCEVIQILTLHAFRPFHSPTSMNAYHTIFSVVRLATLLLMIAFMPSLNVSEATKGWIGYAILVTHACVMIFGFLLNALQTLVEVIARMLGAGGDDIRGQTRGGVLSKIFGMRQLSRRMSRPRAAVRARHGPPFTTSASNSAYAVAPGHSRGESTGSIGRLLDLSRRSSSALVDPLLGQSKISPRLHGDGTVTSYTPTTTTVGETTMAYSSFLPSPGTQTRYTAAPHAAKPAPFFRPPKRKTEGLTTEIRPIDATTPAHYHCDDIEENAESRSGRGPWPATTTPYKDEPRRPTSTLMTPTYSSSPLRPHIDYSTREVDKYYGIGDAATELGKPSNAGTPNRKMATGPGDPTGPLAIASGWLQNMFAGLMAPAKPKRNPTKGFEVTRAPRMPPPLQPTEQPSQGAAPPVALTDLNGPAQLNEQDDSSPQELHAPAAAAQLHDTERPGPVSHKLLNADGTTHEEDDTEGLGITSHMQSPPLPKYSIRRQRRSGNWRDSTATSDTAYTDDDLLPPEIPRKSSKRASLVHTGHSLNASSLNFIPSSPPPPESELEPDRIHRHSSSSSSIGPSRHQRGATPALASNKAPPAAAYSLSPARLPFERSNSQKKRASCASSVYSLTDFSHTGSYEDFVRDANMSLHRENAEQDLPPRGYVSQGNISLVNRNPGLLGSSAELVHDAQRFERDQRRSF